MYTESIYIQHFSHKIISSESEAESHREQFKRIATEQNITERNRTVEDRTEQNRTPYEQGVVIILFPLYFSCVTIKTVTIIFFPTAP